MTKIIDQKAPKIIRKRGNNSLRATYKSYINIAHEVVIAKTVKGGRIV